MKIAILGGTGPEGGGLGLRWAQAGHEVIVGSRQAEKGERVAEELKSRLPETARQRLTGTDNLAAIQQADIAVLAVPYSGQERTLAGAMPYFAWGNRGMQNMRVWVPKQE